MKCYEKCLEVVPFHDEALNSIEFIKKKMGNGTASITDGLVGTLSGKASGVKNSLKHMLATPNEPAPSSSKKKKKEKK